MSSLTNWWCFLQERTYWERSFRRSERVLNLLSEVLLQGLEADFHEKAAGRRVGRKCVGGSAFAEVGMKAIEQKCSSG
jgi:hypothetical protein